eukprot:4728082-Pleurochrysis_carterae.AAC.2
MCARRAHIRRTESVTRADGVSMPVQKSIATTKTGVNALRICSGQPRASRVHPGTTHATGKAGIRREATTSEPRRT